MAGLIAAVAMTAVHAESKYSPARQPAIMSPPSLVPASGFFIGLGGSYNSVNFGTQDVYAVGTSNVFQAGVLTSFGSAAGPASIYMSPESNLGFTVQGGYFQKFSNSDFLWGAKFAYSYLGTSAAVRNALLPQAGSFTTVSTGLVTPFTGNAVVQSYQTKIIQQLAFIPFIGQSFERSFVYLGAGPTLSETRTDLKGVIGFADLNGTRTDVSGTPIDLSSSSWVYGGAAMIGATYFFAPSVFLDVSYTFAMTANHTSDYFSPFTNPNGTGGSTVVGTLVGSTAQQVTTQSVTVTLNKAF